MTGEIIKFLTAGNVDDGKSTLIGRLLHDLGALFEDQIEEVRAQTANDFAGRLDFSLFLDGLLSERAQKITIDVAYRYFSYRGRKFIIADAPGHEEYTRNMAVAAANSDVVIILIDVIKGVTGQAIRHSNIAALFGIKNVVVAVNKMDLVNYEESIFDEIRHGYLAKISGLEFDSVDFVPISAINGENIVKRSALMHWYKDLTIIERLFAAKFTKKKVGNLRFLVQNIVKHENRRLYQGFVAEGILKKSEELSVAGSSNKVKIVEIFGDGNLHGAASVILDREVDLERGAILVDGEVSFADSLRAQLIWFSAKSFDLNCAEEFEIKISHNYLSAQIDKIVKIVDFGALSLVKRNKIFLNQIAEVDLSLSQEVAFDAFEKNKFTGSFLLINKRSNETVACGVIGKENEMEQCQRKLFWKSLRSYFSCKS